MKLLFRALAGPVLRLDLPLYSSEQIPLVHFIDEIIVNTISSELEIASGHILLTGSANVRLGICCLVYVVERPYKIGR